MACPIVNTIRRVIVQSITSRWLSEDALNLIILEQPIKMNIWQKRKTSDKHEYLVLFSFRLRQQLILARKSVGNLKQQNRNKVKDSLGGNRVLIFDERPEL